MRTLYRNLRHNKAQKSSHICASYHNTIRIHFSKTFNKNTLTFCNGWIKEIKWKVWLGWIKWKIHASSKLSRSFQNVFCINSLGTFLPNLSDCLTVRVITLQILSFFFVCLYPTHFQALAPKTKAYISHLLFHVR